MGNLLDVLVVISFIVVVAAIAFGETLGMHAFELFTLGGLMMIMSRQDRAR